MPWRLRSQGLMIMILFAFRRLYISHLSLFVRDRLFPRSPSVVCPLSSAQSAEYIFIFPHVSSRQWLNVEYTALCTKKDDRRYFVEIRANYLENIPRLYWTKKQSLRFYTSLVLCQNDGDGSSMHFQLSLNVKRTNLAPGP
jgi:hypothetical protein